MPLHSCTRIWISLAIAGLGSALNCRAVDPVSPRPNVILILADDLGYSDLGCYGSEIDTPHLDRLARDGVRFSQFYNSAKCEPTRGSLMSGLYWQDTGRGVVRGITMGQAMRAAGYRTLAVGKWHLDGNPVERGFDRYFGHLSGGSDYFRGDASHRLDDQPFTPPNEKFYTTDANADYAIRFIEEARRQHAPKPFFLYLAFNAPHSPLQAWPEDIAKYRGKYRDVGWDRIRQQRHKRQVGSGLIRKEWALAPAAPSVPSWDSMPADERDFEDYRGALYAAMVDRMDQAIGRVLAAVRKLGQEENTLVMFLSDNGGSPFDRGRLGELGDPRARWEYGTGWATVSNTPFRFYKRNMHAGGICTPFIAKWPAVIRPGATIDDRAHIIDLMATLTDVAQWQWPARYGDKTLQPLAGASLTPLFRGKSRPEGAPLYFQLMDHRAIIAGNWKLVSDWNRPWELYRIDSDRTELHDLATKNSRKARELQTQWETWWKDRDPSLFKFQGAEPRYLRKGEPPAGRAASLD